MKSVARKRQKPLTSFIRELVFAVTEDIIAGRKVRCSKCKRFHAAVVASVATCSICIYTSGRCVGCGGEDGAARSVQQHIRAMSGKKSRRRYGEDHYNAAEVKKVKTSRAKAARSRRLRSVA